MTVLSPRQKELFPLLKGNEALKERLGKAILSDSLSHAYIIEGPAGSGKHTLARGIAAALNCECKGESGTPLPCGECPRCRRILGGNAPDVQVCSREDGKATVAVEQIRRIKEDMPLAATDADCKVYIVEEAHLMTPQAQNAFLIGLEEPPKGVLALLLCETADSLLVTVKSRCQTVRTQRLTEEQLRDYLRETDARAVRMDRERPADFRLLTFVSEGCIGKALQYLDERTFAALKEERGRVERVMEAIGDGGYLPLYRALHELTGKQKAARRDICESLSLVMNALRDVLVLTREETSSAARTVQPLFYAERERAIAHGARIAPKKASDAYALLGTAVDYLNLNANVATTVNTLCTALAGK